MVGHPAQQRRGVGGWFRAVAHDDTVYTLQRNEVRAFDRSLQPLWSRTIDEDLTDCDMYAARLVDVPNGAFDIINRGECPSGPYGYGQNWLTAVHIGPTGQILWRSDLGLDRAASNQSFSLLRAGDARFGLASCTPADYNTDGECSGVDIDVTNRSTSVHACEFELASDDAVAYDPIATRLHVVQGYPVDGLTSLDCATGTTSFTDMPTNADFYHMGFVHASIDGIR